MSSSTDKKDNYSGWEAPTAAIDSGPWGDVIRQQASSATDGWPGGEKTDNNDNSGGLKNFFKAKGWLAKVPFLSEQADNTVFMGRTIWSLYTMKSNIDYGDCVDWLNFIFMPSLLGLFAMFSSAQLFGYTNEEPMRCLKPIQLSYELEYKDVWGDIDIAWKWMMDYCRTQNVYWVNQNESIPWYHEERAHREIAYYHWIPVMLIVHSLAFMVPNCIWRNFNECSGIAYKWLLLQCGFLVDLMPEDCNPQKSLKLLAKFQEEKAQAKRKLDEQKQQKESNWEQQEQPSQDKNNDAWGQGDGGWGAPAANENQKKNDDMLKKLEEWAELRAELATILLQSMTLDPCESPPFKILGYRLNWNAFCMSRATLLYLLMKALYLANIICQFGLVNMFITGNPYNYKWGYELIKTLCIGSADDFTGINLFPRHAFCDVPIYRIGNLERITIQCHLGLNYYNEKIFITIWCLLLSVGFITFFNVLYNVSHFLFNRHLIEEFIIDLLGFKHDDNEHEQLVDFANNSVSMDGYLLLWYAQHHFGDDVIIDLLDQMFAIYGQVRKEIDKVFRVNHQVMEEV